MLKNTPELRSVPLAEVVALAVNEKNRSAVAVLFEKYNELLVSRVRYIVNNHQTAEDIANDTFVHVWELIQQERVSPETIDHFEPWLFKIAANRAIGYLRHTKKFKSLPLPENEPNDPEAYALALHPRLSEVGFEEQRCDQLCLKQAVAAMSSQYRVCVLLRVQWEFKQREIAELLDISEQAVSKNIKGGLRQLHMIYTRMISDPDIKTKGERKRYGKINLQAL